jgi:hypothetical protein
MRLGRLGEGGFQRRHVAIGYLAQGAGVERICKQQDKGQQRDRSEHGVHERLSQKESG